MVFNVATNPQNVYVQNCLTIVVKNDQSLVKSALWGFAAFKFGSATLGVAAGTLLTSPFIVTPLAGIPIALGYATAFFGSMTSSCIDNVGYHLGNSHKVIVLQHN